MDFFKNLISYKILPTLKSYFGFKVGILLNISESVAEFITSLGVPKEAILPSFIAQILSEFVWLLYMPCIQNKCKML